jgi:ankyrin repeat protein
MSEEFQLCSDAIRDGDLGELRRLIRQHPAVLQDRDPIGTTLLMVACSPLDSIAEPRVIEMLLAEGANPLDVDGRKNTALHHIADSNVPDYPQPVRAIAGLLAQKGLPMDAKDVFGNTALMKAVFSWRQGMAFDAIDALLDLGSDPALQNHHGVSPLSLAMTTVGMKELAAHMTEHPRMRSKAP